MPLPKNFGCKKIDMHQETEKILIIVNRNLQPENWLELSPEAQKQIAKEVKRLLCSQLVSLSQKQQLRSLLKSINENASPFVEKSGRVHNTTLVVAEARNEHSQPESLAAAVLLQ